MCVEWLNDVLEGKKMRRFLCLCFTVLLLAGNALAMSDLVLTSDGWQSGSGFLAAQYAVVNGTKSLNLREGPGTSYKKIGEASQGQWVVIQAQTGNWAYVTTVAAGQTGYMSMNFLITEEVHDNPTGDLIGIVNNPKDTEHLNLRQYASFEAPVLGTYYNGACCRILSIINDWWYQVEIDGIIGFFRTEYIKLKDETVPYTYYVSTDNGGTLNLRAGPTDRDEVIGRIANGSQVEVVLKGNEYFKVRVNGVIGFAYSGYLTARQEDILPVTQTIIAPYAIVNNPKDTQTLNFRMEPNTDSAVMGKYRNGDRFELLAAGDEWCQVYQQDTGETGYLMTKYLTLYGATVLSIKTVQNGTHTVNLRENPDLNAIVLELLNTGDQVVVRQDLGEWSVVQHGENLGYMMSKFLK